MKIRCIKCIAICALLSLAHCKSRTKFLEQIGVPVEAIIEHNKHKHFEVAYIYKCPDESAFSKVSNAVTNHYSGEYFKNPEPISKSAFQFINYSFIDNKYTKSPITGFVIHSKDEKSAIQCLRFDGYVVVLLADSF